MGWLVIATWSTALKGVREAARELDQKGCTANDAVELIARIEEDDPENCTVGFGGFPNKNGEVELDAAFMDGKDMSIGAVAAVKGYKNPVSIARQLMTGSMHTMLVGQGAEDFAASNGFTRGIIMTDGIRKAWEERIKETENPFLQAPIGHDTIGAVALDSKNHMAVATSSSGMGMKHRGRVGDSPLVGSGFFVDDEIGGAAATGLGEDIMKGCTCYAAVDLMRQGLSPQQAAEEAVRRTHMRLKKHMEKVGCIAVVCADNKGRYGGAANHEGFTYAVASSECEPVVVHVTPIE